MCPLPDTIGSDSHGSPQGDPWDYKPNHDAQFVKDQIKRANQIPILSIIKAYGIKVDQNTKHILCPFSKRHKNGKDKSPSFTIYTNNNSFWCFGCRTGKSCVDFVMNMEEIGLFKAAQKILSGHIYEASLEDLNCIHIDYTERLEILMGFSDYIRSFMISNITDGDRYFLEEICAVLDNLNTKYKKTLDNTTLISIIDRLKKKVEDRFQCPAM